MIILKLLFDYLFTLDYSKADDIYFVWVAVILLIFYQVNNFNVKLDPSLLLFLPAMYRVVSSA